MLKFLNLLSLYRSFEVYSLILKKKKIILYYFLFIVIIIAPTIANNNIKEVIINQIE